MEAYNHHSATFTLTRDYRVIHAYFAVLRLRVPLETFLSTAFIVC